MSDIRWKCECDPDRYYFAEWSFCPMCGKPSATPERPKRRCQCQLEAGDSPCPVHSCPICDGEHDCDQCRGNVTNTVCVSCGAKPAQSRTANLDKLTRYSPRMSLSDSGEVVMAIANEGAWIFRWSAIQSANADIDAAVAAKEAEKEEEIKEILDKLTDVESDRQDAEGARKLMQAEVAKLWTVVESVVGEGEDGESVVETAARVLIEQKQRIAELESRATVLSVAELLVKLQNQAPVIDAERAEFENHNTGCDCGVCLAVGQLAAREGK